MKKIIILLIFLNSISCNTKKIEHNSTIHLNLDIIENTLEAWLYDGECKKDVEIRFNKDMDLFYNHKSGGTNPEFLNPIYIQETASRNFLDLNYLIETRKEFQDVKILDSIILQKHFELDRSGKKLINSTLSLMFYKLESNNKSTLILNKVTVENSLLDTNEVITPFLKNNYQLDDGNIVSNFGYYYSIKTRNGYYKFPVEIENIRLENNTLEYDDRTNIYMKHYTENNIKNEIEVIYE